MTLLQTPSGDLTIESGGMLTHPRTSSKSKTMDVRVAGRMWVKEGGQIHANEMSSYCGPGSNCYDTWGCGYGGSGQRQYLISDNNGPSSGTLRSSVYGDFQNPDDLGAASLMAVRLAGSWTAAHALAEGL